MTDTRPKLDANAFKLAIDMQLHHHELYKSAVDEPKPSAIVQFARVAEYLFYLNKLRNSKELPKTINEYRMVHYYHQNGYQQIDDIVNKMLYKPLYELSKDCTIPV